VANDLDTCLALLPEKARAVFARAPEEYGFRPTPLWRVQQQEMERRLRETIRALAEVSQDTHRFARRPALGWASHRWC